MYGDRRTGKAIGFVRPSIQSSSGAGATFTCSLAGSRVPLPHFWEHTVGSCHAPLALRADWQRQLERAHRELGFRHIRFHGLLSDDLGTLICHDEKLLHSFFNADQVFDFLLSIGMRPFVELSFMPTALASGKATVFHYRANVTPPRDYGRWQRFISRLARHWVERYGTREVGKWPFEVWNEPNLRAFWRGTRAEYFRLYHHTARAIKGVEPGIPVGGPATAQNAWLEEFLDFCARSRAPVDFVTSHHYPSDVPGYEKADTETQLSHGRRSMLREWAQDASRRARGLPLYYTEWNTSTNSRDPLHDDPYAAAFIVKTVLEMNGLVDGYSFWTFSDIFEENYFPSVPFHGGFGLLSLHGVPKPAYRAFELLHRLGTELLVPVDGMHITVDAWVVPNGSVVTVLLSNHALPRHSITSQRVHLRLTESAHPRRAVIERIDQDHANAPRLWREIEAPEYLGPAEVERLEDASRLRAEPLPLSYDGNAIDVELVMAPHSVAAVTIELDAVPVPLP